MTLCIFKKKIKLGGWRPDPANKIYLPFDSSKLSLTKNTIEYVGDQDIDLRPYSSPVQDQGSTGSCVANSLVKALEIKRIIKKGHVAHVDLSRLGLYYNARERMNPSEVKKDSGTYIA